MISLCCVPHAGWRRFCLFISSYPSSETTVFNTGSIRTRNPSPKALVDAFPIISKKVLLVSLLLVSC